MISGLRLALMLLGLNRRGRDVDWNKNKLEYTSSQESENLQPLPLPLVHRTNRQENSGTTCGEIKRITYRGGNNGSML